MSLAPPPQGLKRKCLWREASFVNGEWLTAAPGGATLPVLNPATGEVVGRIPNYGAALVDEAVAVAKKAQEKWKLVHAKKRGQVLAKSAALIHAHLDDLALINTSESGKPFVDAKLETQYAASYIEWYAGEAERVYGDILQQPRDGARTLVVKQPVGVVGVITPWNMPCAMVTRSCGAAFAAGCSVVLKPADLTPFTAAAVVELAIEAGVPAGLLNIVTGEAAPIGNALTANDTVRKICFTGSTRVGKLLYRQSAESMKKLSLELGGNAPFLVFADANLDLAVDGIMASKFRNAGQACVCTNRVFVHESVHDALLEKLTAHMKSHFVIGNGLAPGVTMGPLITAGAAANINKKVEEAVAAGAVKTHPIKEAHTPFPTKNFVLPTVLTNVNDSMRISCEEIFGPIVAMTKFSDEAEVVRRANNVKVGLAAYLYTEDYRRQWRVFEALEFGMIGVNEGAIGAATAPFGGVKHSGLGRDGAKYGIEGFLDVKYVLLGGKL